MTVFIRFCLTCGRQLFHYEVTGHGLVVVGLWEEGTEFYHLGIVHPADTVAIGVPEEQES